MTIVIERNEKGAKWQRKGREERIKRELDRVTVIEQGNRKENDQRRRDKGRDA